MREISVPLPGREQSYRILVGPGLSLDLGDLLAPLNLPRQVFLISDRRVMGLHAKAVLDSLAAGGFAPTLLTVPVGERYKTWATVQRLARQLLSQGAHRGSALIALGGGVVGDLTGFLASIYMRGTPVIQLPTTLLAMVDAAIGGKTGINLPEGKNLLGTFHQPRLVVIDPEFLFTLPWAEIINGLAEVLKAGFIREADLLARVSAVQARLFENLEELTEIIFRAASIKAQIVAADEREADLRRILNFGHTLGHALEAAANFRLPHGRAVAWGMVAALELSRRLTGLAPEEAEEGRRIIQDGGLARTLPALDLEKILAALPLDKKRGEEGLVFVLLKKWGEPVIRTDVPLELVGEVWQGLGATGGGR